MAGIFRTGYTAFPVSPRNSPAAVAHLLRKANVSHVLVGPESALQGLIATSLSLLKDDEGPKPSVSEIPAFDEIYRPESEHFEPLGPGTFKFENAAVILHSSGSTAFPKPIAYTHYQLLHVGFTPCKFHFFAKQNAIHTHILPLDFGEIDFTGRRFSCHSMPMYHGMGMMQTAWTVSLKKDDCPQNTNGPPFKATSGLVVTAFEPRSPAIFPDPDTVMKASMDTKSDILFCVPSFVEVSDAPTFGSRLLNFHHQFS